MPLLWYHTSHTFSFEYAVSIPCFVLFSMKSLGVPTRRPLKVLFVATLKHGTLKWVSIGATRVQTSQSPYTFWPLCFKVGHSCDQRFDCCAVLFCIVLFTLCWPSWVLLLWLRLPPHYFRITVRLCSYPGSICQESVSHRPRQNQPSACIPHPEWAQVCPVPFLIYYLG